MRFLGSCVLGYVLLYSSTASADDDSIKWSWRCAPSGYYALEVLPNGTTKPVTDYSDKTPLEVIIKEAGKGTGDICSWNSFPTHYYAEVNGNQLATLFNSSGPCEQFVRAHTTLTHVGSQSYFAIDRLTAISFRDGPISLLIHRDDADWKFILSLSDLTTEQESRRLRIYAPQAQSAFDPKADTGFLTGECLMTVGQ